MRAALYTRVSSQEQAQHGVSLAEQKERLESWAKMEGWTIAGFYSDEGYSGGNDERPELQWLMVEAEAGMFDILAVSKLDRFFRNTRQLLNYIYALKANGVTFVSQAEGIDTSIPGIGNVAIAYRVNTWPRRYWRAFMSVTSTPPYPVDIIRECKGLVDNVEPAAAEIKE